MPKLTKRIIDASKPRAKDFFVWDNDLPGFGIRVFASGKKSYLVQYRVKGRSRRYTIGLHGPFTPEKARIEAMGLLAAIAKGEDPAEEKAVGQTSRSRSSVISISRKAVDIRKPVPFRST